MQNSLRECFQLEIQASTLGIFNFLKHFAQVKENHESNFDNLFYVGILVWVNSGSWWWTGRPGVLQSMGSKTVRHDWVSELNWTDFMWPNTARVLIQPAIDTKMMLIRSSHFFLWHRVLKSSVCSTTRWMGHIPSLPWFYMARSCPAGQQRLWISGLTRF